MFGHTWLSPYIYMYMYVCIYIYMVNKDSPGLNLCLLLVNVGPKGDSRKGKKASYGTGKETLRFRANGEAQIEQVRVVILIYGSSFKCTGFLTLCWLQIVKQMNWNSSVSMWLGNKRVQFTAEAGIIIVIISEPHEVRSYIQGTKQKRFDS
jgi:hypothetical protein